MYIKFSLNFEENYFFKILKKYNYQFTNDDILAGKIISFEKYGFVLDIGTKILAYLPKSELFFEKNIFYSKEIFKYGENFELLLYYYDYKKKIVLTSISELKTIALWQRIHEISKEKIITRAKHKKATKHGKIINIQGLRGFVFNSELPKYYRRKQLNKLILPLIFLKLNYQKNFLFFSCKLTFFKNQIGRLKIQKSFNGCVTQVKSYGLFINIYGIKGFLHISEISSKRIKNLPLLFKTGDLILVTVLFINKNLGRISLSKKILEQKL